MLEIEGETPHSIFRSDAQRSVKQKERKKQELERQVFTFLKLFLQKLRARQVFHIFPNVKSLVGFSHFRIIFTKVQHAVIKDTLLNRTALGTAV